MHAASPQGDAASAFRSGRRRNRRCEKSAFRCCRAALPMWSRRLVGWQDGRRRRDGAEQDAVRIRARVAMRTHRADQSSAPHYPPASSQGRVRDPGSDLKMQKRRIDNFSRPMKTRTLGFYSVAFSSWELFTQPVKETGMRKTPKRIPESGKVPAGSRSLSGLRIPHSAFR
jgi:hypothetical protein